jgi:hypothetical protein
MRTASFFPTYSQPENVVTNAVLVMFSQVYRLAPDVFTGLLTKLTDVEHAVGPQFFNQITAANGPGIPDGLITQPRFNIYFETKLGDALGTNQIRRHFETIEKRDGIQSGSVLIGLTRSALDPEQIRELAEYGQQKGIVFSSTTFSALADLASQETAEYRLELNALLDEFRFFIQEQGIAEPSENWLLINPCGDTIEQNARFNIYHDQPGRAKRFCKYLGCYTNKSVRLVGRVSKIVVARFENDELKVDENISLPWQSEAGKDLTDDERQRIYGIVEHSQYALRNEIVRYYLVDRFVPTDFRKISPYGIMGHRRFKLDDEIEEYGRIVGDVFKGGEPEIEVLADALRRVQWS